MSRRTMIPNDARFHSIKNTAYLTGLSQGFIRQGCKNGTIPHIRCGNEYKIDVSQFLEMLTAEAMANTSTETGGQ